MRITGLATGMDMDQLVKETMQPYRIKIQQQKQQKDIMEIKQQLYRDVIKESRELYNKYFDVAKTDSLLLSKNWSTVKFQSSNENVLTVTGGSDAKPGNYTVTGNTATAAKAIVTEGLDSGNSLVINGKEFTLQGDTAKARAENLNKELKAAGMKVSVRYSDFAGTEAGNQSGFIFESTVLGKDSAFIIGGTPATVHKGIDGTAATVTGFTVQNLKDANGEININGEIVTIDIKDEYVYDDIEKLLQSKLKDKKLTAEIAENGDITFSSTVFGSKVEDPKIEVNGNGGTFTKGIDATNTVSLGDIKNKKISINGNVIDMSKAVDGQEVEYLNKALKEQNINVTARLDEADPSKIVFTSTKVAAEIGILNGGSISSPGTDAAITIKDDKGGVYTHSGISNTLTLDGMTFKFTGEIPAEGISVNGKNDAAGVKDKLVNFINDYNKLMEKINTLTTEKRNRNYMPLTDEQKKEMSENEIKIWNEKVKQGQLYKDSDVSRIANSMKSAMRGLVDGVDGSLEKFGIKPVADYQGTKNGTFIIDEDKLNNALENNLEDVMKLFISTPPSDDSLSALEKNKSTGVAQRLKGILYNETVSISSSLINKVGIEGSASSVNSEITKAIKKYDRKMEDMEKDFAKREQQLYSKWATIESMMNKLNAQQSYLTSQLGM
ncbi:MAG: flagellar cap protein FliD [Clostridium sulfidigenes]|uniref:Flagellar hook-associated protein 2 n=1 Tax=Clostridium sulfidigenes TaxID=318464 RepID=A0A927W7K7_9CLOT|nr:flagellar cap protein FliD [Clostridium sulfidigenes]